MDEYEKKLISLEKYIPFLKNMIAQLKDPSKKNREAQLSKMESLYTMITDRNKRLKLDTLQKCEDVIIRLHNKVNNKPLISTDSPKSTPASPSPPRDIILSKPVVIPTEKVGQPNRVVDTDTLPRKPIVDIYSIAGTSLTTQKKSMLDCNKFDIVLSKPPISLDDLKTLQEDVHDKILNSPPNSFLHSPPPGNPLQDKSLDELCDLKKKIALELEQTKKQCAESINTTLKISQALKKKSPEKKKAPAKVTPVKIIKDSDSIFGDMLSKIDNQLIEKSKEKDPKKERRISSGSKEDKKERRSSKEHKHKKDDKKKDHKSKESKAKEPEEVKQIAPKTEEKPKPAETKKPEDDGIDIQKFKRIADKYNKKPKKPTVEPEVVKQVSDTIQVPSSTKSDPFRIPFLGETIETVVSSTVNNPVPKMVSPPKMVPPPVVNLINSMVDHLKKQNTMNVPTNTFQQNRTSNVNIPLQNFGNVPQSPMQNFGNVPQSPMQNFGNVPQSPMQNFGNVPQSPMQNFGSPDYNNPNPPSNRVPPIRNEPQQFYNNRPDFKNRPNDNFNQQPYFERPQQNDFDNFHNNRPNSRMQFRDPHENEYLEDHQFVQQNQFNFEPPHNEMEFNNFHQNQNAGMPVLSPQEDMGWEQKNFHHEVEDHRPPWKRNQQNSWNHRGGRGGRFHNNRDPRSYREHREKLQRENENYENLEQQQQQIEKPNIRDEPNYRDPRQARMDPRQQNRDPRQQVREDPRHQPPPQQNRDPRQFQNKSQDPRRNERGRSMNRDFERDNSSTRDDYRYRNRFDRVYSGRDDDDSRRRSRSRSRSRPRESFHSPLDSLYTGDKNNKTGKGYGVQNFKIPKIKKETDFTKDITEEEPTKEAEEANAEAPTLPPEGDSIEEPEVPEDIPKIIESTPEAVSSSVQDEVPEIPKSKPETETLADNTAEVSSTEEHPKQQEEKETKKPADTNKAEQNILAQFFANLMGSENKKDKKGALLSLISTFSDSFSDTQLKKITSIIKDSDEDEPSTSSKKSAEDSTKEEESKEEEQSVCSEVTEQDEPEEVHEEVEEETPKVEEVKVYKKRGPKPKKKATEAEEVQVSVGERIKSNKRTPPKKFHKKSELDMLHEDIQDMFIRDGVLTANGKRLCRKLKSDPQALNTETKEEPKKKVVKKDDKKTAIDIKHMPTVKVVLNKISTEEGRTLRSRKSVNLKEDEESSESSSSDESEEEEQEEEEEAEEEKVDNENTQSKRKKRKRNLWASGMIKKWKKKKRDKSITTDESFIEPDVSFLEEKAKMQCKHCTFSHKYLAQHYRMNHPEEEIWSSRLSKENAKLALDDAKFYMKIYEELVPKFKLARKYQFACRFCTHNNSMLPIAFYDHVTMHTGEFRYCCNDCNYVNSHSKGVKAHMQKPEFDTHQRTITASKIQGIYTFLFMCGDCNYCQIDEENVKKHVKKSHGKNCKIFKINSSTLPILEADVSDDLLKRRLEMEKELQKDLDVVDSTANEPEEPVVKKRKCIRKKSVIDDTASEVTEDEDLNKTADKEQPTKKKKPGKKSMDISPLLKALYTNETDEESKSSLLENLNASANLDSSSKDIVLPQRSKRAAKEKATAKMKAQLEETYVKPPKVQDKQEESPPELQKQVAEELPAVETPAIIPVKEIKKDIEMNVFTCDTDINDENEKIEQERLKKMEDINKAVATNRNTLDFVEKLSSRLQKEVAVKPEPVEEGDNVIIPEPELVLLPALERPVTPVMPVLEKSVKKPLFIEEELLMPIKQKPQKANTFIAGMIDKLRDSLQKPVLSKDIDLKNLSDNDSDCSGPPPLVHVKDVNVKPCLRQSVIFNCSYVKVIKNEDILTYSCQIPPCVYTSENQDVFMKHCKDRHSKTDEIDCDICKIKFETLEDMFRHVLNKHLQEFGALPRLSILKMRRLSGDKLSSNVDGSCSDMEMESVVSDNIIETRNLDDLLPDNNPFGFKISGVMSLAEESVVPPLTPISGGPRMFERSMKSHEINMPRKDKNAMKKFLIAITDLYKCPVFTCTFSTNFRNFFTTHLKTHKFNESAMMPCVYWNCHFLIRVENYANHVSTKHGMCTFACGFCLYRSVNHDYVYNHHMQEHKDKAKPKIIKVVPSEPICTEFDKDLNLRPQPYKCHMCSNAVYLFEDEFNRHMLRHNFVDLIRCGHESCRAMESTKTMVQHWNSVHKVRPYQCAYCPDSATTAQPLFRHQIEAHWNKPPMVLHRVQHSENTEHVLVKTGYGNEEFSNVPVLRHLPENMRPPKVIETASSKTLSPKQMQFKIVGDAIKLPTSTTGTILKIIPADKVPDFLKNKNIHSKPIPKLSIANLPSQITSTATIVSATTSPSLTTLQPGTPSIQVFSFSGQNLMSSTSESETTTTATFGASVPTTPEVVGNQPEVDPLSVGVDSETESMRYKATSSEDEWSDRSSDKSSSKHLKKQGLSGEDLFKCHYCGGAYTTVSTFKNHISRSMTCRSILNRVKPFECAHCHRALKSAQALVDHIEYHGTLKYACSLCEEKSASAVQIRNHMKNKHNVSQDLLFENNQKQQDTAEQMYIVRPKFAKSAHKTTVIVKEQAQKTLEPPAPENLEFVPDTIGAIPVRAIFSTPLKCGLCGYTNKVRTNFVRHLNMHRDEKAVPDSAPVNPVPCLDKNEKMFDKMTNLAYNGFQGGRMGAKEKNEKEPEEKEKIPEFVPSHCRYVCCAENCNYLCPEEANLKHHIVALHTDETKFTCAHCKSALYPTDADSLVKHFRLHGLHLYKCGWCNNFMTYLRNKIEKHCDEMHPDYSAKMKIIRFMESEPADDREGTSSAPITTAKTGFRHWRCSLCKYRCKNEDDVKLHVLNKHDLNSKYKCTLCTFKSDVDEEIVAHFTEEHPDKEFDVISVYSKLENKEEGNKKEEESFDTTPLWGRNRPGLKHIRGILFEDVPSPTQQTKSPSKKTPKSAAASPKPSTSTATSSSATYYTPPSTPSSIDSSIEAVATGNFTAVVKKQPKKKTDKKVPVKEDMIAKINKEFKEAAKAHEKLQKQKLLNTEVVVIVSDDDDEPPDDVDSSSMSIRSLSALSVKSEEPDTTLEAFNLANLIEKFGGFGSPLNRQFKCPVCEKFKSKQVVDFIFHLYKEKKVKRFQCKQCTARSVAYDFMRKHVKLMHNSERAFENVTALDRNKKLETWIRELLRSQSEEILRNHGSVPAEIHDHLPKKYKCQFCNEKFHNKNYYQEHQLTHWKDKPYQCKKCEFSHVRHEWVAEHSKNEHPYSEGDYQVVAPIVATVIADKDELDKNAEQKELKLFATISKEKEKSVEITEEKNQSVEVIEEITPTPMEQVLEVVSEKKICDSSPAKEEIVFTCDLCAVYTRNQIAMEDHANIAHHSGKCFKRIIWKAYAGNANYNVHCWYCDVQGPDLKVRDHHMEKHPNSNYRPYKFTCELCPTRYMSTKPFKMHFAREHNGAEVRYRTLANVPREQAKEVQKLYKCTLCNYLSSSSKTNNMRMHIRHHTKPVSCGVCHIRFPFASLVRNHFQKKHPFEVEKIDEDKEKIRETSDLMSAIIDAAKPIDEIRRQNIAKKSTSKPQTQTIQQTEEFSFYGTTPTNIDLKKIKTTVEVNKVALNMTADQLGNIFDLNSYVEVEKYNPENNS